MMKLKLFICLSFCAFVLQATVVLSADKVVVVPLASSSLKKQYTYVYGHDEFKIRGIDGSIISSINGCAYNTNSPTGYIPLSFPVGTKIVAIYVNILDYPLDHEYTIGLTRNTLNEIGVFSEVVIETTGGILTAGLKRKVLTPKITEIVDEGEWFSLVFTSEVGGKNGFCSAEITLELP